VDFKLTDEQSWLSESIAELIAREPTERLWPALVEFGALQDELGVLERALVAYELGLRLAAVPYVDSAAAHYALEGVASATSAACCLGEPGRSFAPSDPSTSLDDTRLTGEKCGVSFAGRVDVLAVPASAARGLVVALVPASAAELEVEVSLDPSLEPATVRFEGVEASDVVAADVPLLAAVAGVLAVADAVGAAASALALACEYAAQRRQFGHTIGSFQAVRHLLAEMYVKVESSWSSVLYASAVLDERASDCLRTASIAKAYAARATHEVAHGALQVFGGIAFTQEHSAHRHLRRIAVRGGQFGTAGEHELALGRSLARGLEVLA
jgi:alkylation response protein AidB-like acyl-CoA dehydrogenase